MDKINKNSRLFRSISVHYYRFFSYLCTGINNRTGTTMAGTVKDMSLIKQVLQLKQLGESNRGISRKLPIDKETVNIYVRTMSANGWSIDELLRKDDYANFQRTISLLKTLNIRALY